MLIRFSVHGMTHTLEQWQLHAICLAPVNVSIILALKASSGHCFVLVCLKVFLPFNQQPHALIHSSLLSLQLSNWFSSHVSIIHTLKQLASCSVSI